MAFRDITFCHDDGCPYKATCQRHHSRVPDDTTLRVSYFAQSPRSGDKCDMYWGELCDEIIEMIFRMAHDVRD